MASIDKRNDGFRVRWRALDGSPRSRQCPDKATAQKLQRKVETALALGEDWEADSPAPSAPKLIDVADKYMTAQEHTLAVRTQRVLTYQLDVFLRFLEEWKDGEPDTSWLSRPMLLDYLAWLRSGTGRHGAVRELGTSRRYVAVIERVWAWAHDWQDEYAGWAGQVPRPRRVSTELRLPAQQWRPAPTWQEMAWCVQAAPEGWLRQLLTLLFYTGLRVQQALDLLRTDVDVERRILTIRPDLGKTPQEQTGRAIPISPHLAAWVRELKPVEGGWLLPCDRKVRLPRDRDVAAAWERTKARRDAWEGRPHHCFRAGWVSGARALGAELDAVEFMVGHAPTETAKSYLDPDALGLRSTVDLIPSIEVALRGTA